MAAPLTMHWAKAAEPNKDCTLGVIGHFVILRLEGLARRMEAGGERSGWFPKLSVCELFLPF